MNEMEAELVRAKAGFSKYTDIVIASSSIPKLLKDALDYLPSEEFIDNQFPDKKEAEKKKLKRT